MKLTIVLLVAVVCFAAINATPSGQEELLDLFDDDEFLSDVVFGDEMYDPYIYNIFSSFFWYLKAALRALKGVNCSIKEVIKIKSETETFLKNIQTCGDDAVKAFANVITSSKKIIAICDKIIHLNEKVCNNDESTNGKKSTPWSCVIKLFRQFYQLRKEIRNTMKAIKKVPAVPGDAAYCTKSAVNLLIDALNAFPSNVKFCSKLKH